MQGLVFDIRRYSVHDGPGIRTTVFLKGCPLRCRWCHNPEGLLNTPEIVDRVYRLEDKEICVKEELGRFMTPAEVVEEVLKDKQFYEESDGGATISGGEPLQQIAFLVELLTSLKEQGIHTTLDTSGFASNIAVQQVAYLTDLFLYDLKHINTVEHQLLTGVRNDVVLYNLRYLVKAGRKVIIRYPMIPGMNDSDENLMELEALFAEMPTLRELHILPYHSIAKGKYKRLGLENAMEGIAEPTRERVDQVATRFKEFGLIVKIGG